MQLTVKTGGVRVRRKNQEKGNGNDEEILELDS